MSDEDEVWRATVDDNTWEARVLAVEEYRGHLTVTKVDGGEVILSEPVGLSFNAQFGPDVDDVRLWQTMAIDAIDHYNAQPGSVTEPEGNEQ